MGIREIIRKALGYRLGTPTGMMGLTEMKVPPGWQYQNYLQAYGQIGWLFACVNIISNAVARQPWHLYDIDNTGDRDEITNHALLDLINHPNQFQSRYQFMYLATMYKKLVGEEFWQINFAKKGTPAEMWLAPPAYMDIIPSAVNYIDHYEYKRPGMPQGIKFSTDEIIHIMTPNPYNPYRGLSEAQALTTDLDSERYAAKYQQKLFFNEGVPGFIVKYPAADMPPAETRQELVQEWDERFKGFRNRGKTAFLWGGEPSTITLSNRDMDFATLRNFDRDIILGAYGVPKSVLGLTETSTFASAKAGNYSFAFYVIHPELCAIREAINKELVPFFGDNLLLDFENPVPEDETMSANNATNLYKTGIIKLNEGRKMVGLDPIDEPEGDEFYKAPAPVSPFGGNPQNPADNSPEKETPIDEDKKKAFESEELKEAFWRGYVGRAESYEAVIISELREKLFNIQRDEAIAKFRANAVESINLIDQKKNKQRYIDLMLPILARCMDAAIRNGRELVEPENPHKTKEEPGGVSSIPPVLNKRALEWLKTRLNWAADEIGEESASRLNTILADGFAEGLGTDEIVNNIRDEFDQYFSQTRASRISRTETIGASAQGTIEGYRESGQVSKIQFYTAMDERTCEYCNEYHNQIYQIGDQMPIPLHPQCRCIWLPVIE